MCSRGPAAALVALLVMLAAGGCNTTGDEARLSSPYDEQQVWAVVPLRNESGSIEPDPMRIADHLARQLETAEGLTVLAVNRVLSAMDAAGLASLEDPAQAQELRRLLNADAIVVGTLTAYDSYDPPAIGLALELFAGERWVEEPGHGLNVRELVRAGTDTLARPEHLEAGAAELMPASLVTGLWYAADPGVRRDMQRYAHRRGIDRDDPAGWQLYRISMDLFTEFVAFSAAERLLEAEARRLRSPRGDDAGPPDNPS